MLLHIVMRRDIPLPRPTIERSNLDETISFDRKELAKALEHADDDSKKSNQCRAQCAPFIRLCGG